VPGDLAFETLGPTAPPSNGAVAATGCSVTVATGRCGRSPPLDWVADGVGGSDCDAACGADQVGWAYGSDDFSEGCAANGAGLSGAALGDAGLRPAQPTREPSTSNPMRVSRRISSCCKSRRVDQLHGH
jgi:hypothetical protein